MAIDPTNTDDAPAWSSASTSAGLSIPPPALMGFVKPCRRASLTHSATMDSSGAPDNPPPPYFFNGDSTPNRPRQSIVSGNSPQGMVFEMQIASQLGCFPIASATSIEVVALSFGIIGIPSV